MFFCDNFWLCKDTTLLLPASCFSCQDASNGIWFDLERSCWKFDLRSRSWPDPKRLCCMSGDPYHRPEHIYGVFIAVAGLYQTLLPKNCWWPSMTWNDLDGHNIPTQGVNSTCKSMFESVLNGFRPKEVLFIFILLTDNGEVAKLTWS